jgi:polysaccharide export outer membrane protein
MPRHDGTSSKGRTSTSATSVRQGTSESTVDTRACNRCASKAIGAVLLVVAAEACGGASAPYPYANEPDPRGGEYVIGVADELVVSVWRNRDLDTSMPVRPDGNITLPLVGDVRAAGRSPSDLTRAIRDRLRAFVREEESAVTVAIKAVNSYYVTVAGSVVTPGRITSKSYLTVVDAIALAGGPTRFAVPSETMLVRRALDGTLRRIPVDYERILTGRALEQNLVLFRGARLYVP